MNNREPGGVETLLGTTSCRRWWIRRTSGARYGSAGYPNERPDAACMFFAGSVLLQRNLTKLLARACTQ